MMKLFYLYNKFMLDRLINILVKYLLCMEDNMKQYWKLKLHKSVDLGGQVKMAVHINLPDGRKVLCPDEATAKLIVQCVNARLRAIRQGRLSKQSNL